MTMGIVGVVLVAGGALAVALGLGRRRGTEAATAMGWLAAELPSEAGTPAAGRPVSPFVTRTLGAAIARLGAYLAATTPTARLDRLHRQLLHAGLANSIRAEDLLAVNLLTAVGSAGLGVAWVAVSAPPTRLAIAGVVLLTTVGVCVPRAWLSRQVTARRDALMRDLPDALDLMVIAMEAGMTFDGAIQVVTEHLHTPLGDELAQVLAEMELGQSRRDALSNLKHRVDIPEFSNVVAALLQADALGMSVGRVLHVQSGEMRAKRRQWAREKAGKLPVKILFPLVAFIFPPVFVIILGPVVGDIYGVFG